MAVTGLSPVTMTVRIPISRSSAMRSRMPGFRTSDSAITPRISPSTETASGVAPFFATAVCDCFEIRRLRCAEPFGDMPHDGIHRPFADNAARRARSNPLIRVSAEKSSRLARSKQRIAALRRAARRR